MGAITIRPARPQDLPAIADFTQETFDWGDYVADALPVWLQAPDSQVLVAITEDDIPVGIGRVVLLSPREAWLHGARIHPDHRRTGIGSTLNESLIAWARDHGAVIARLLIEDWNTPAQRQVTGLGYRRVSGWMWATHSVGTDVDPATNGGRRVPGDERLGPGSHAEIDPSWIAWLSSSIASAGRQLFPIGWHFRQMRLQDVVDGAKRGALWHCPSGWVIAERDGDELFVSWVVTSDLDVDRLLRAVLDRAERLEVELVRVMSPRISWMEDALDRLGWRTNPCGIWARTIGR